VHKFLLVISFEARRQAALGYLLNYVKRNVFAA
jgi:hypothetical protein